MKPSHLSLTVGAGAALAAFAFVFVSRQSSDAPGPSSAARSVGAQAVAKTGAPAEGASAVAVVGDAAASPAEAENARIVARLQGLKTLAGGGPADMRKLVGELERLRAMGPAALPAIRDYLHSAEDADFEAGGGRGGRGGRVPLEFVVPPSLRLGLLSVVKDIGGDAAQQLLVDELKTTGRGVEVAYIAGALKQMGGEQHAASVASAARDLLAMPPLPTEGAGRLDRSDRDFLYNVLTDLGDKSYVAQAQAQVVQANGQLDRASLRYLQTTLGEQSVAVAAQLWGNPAIAPDRREPIVQMALAYVGVNEQANQLFQAAINDPGLNPNDRREIIEDLDERGISDRRNPTAADLALIDRRLALIEASMAANPAHIEAFKEAQEDLLEIRARGVGRPRG